MSGRILHINNTSGGLFFSTDAHLTSNAKQINLKSSGPIQLSTDKTITLEPGNQIELSGAKLNNLHLSCSESYKFLKELGLACKSLNLNMMSVSFDPISNLKNVPKNPKLRYKIMTKEMPKNGKLSLEMMHQTTGSQINLDYTSEKDFIKKFKLASNLVPLSIAIFANSPFKEKK